MALGPLGLPRTASWSGFAASVPWPPADEMETLLNVQHCIGTESSLEDCARRPWGKQACAGDDGVAGVVCLADVDAVTSAAIHPVRLTGGSSPECGIVEVALGDGLWGTVCAAPSSASSSSSSVAAAATAATAASASGSAAPLSSNHTHPQAQKGKLATIAAAASVVCRQLGYTGGWLIGSAIASASTSASVSTTAAQIMLPVLSGMACQGNESSLLRCDHDGWGDASACSNAGAGGRLMAVECYGGGSSRPPPAYPPHYHHHQHVSLPYYAIPHASMTLQPSPEQPSPGPLEPAAGGNPQSPPPQTQPAPAPLYSPPPLLLPAPSYAPVKNEPLMPTPRPPPLYARVEDEPSPSPALPATPPFALPSPSRTPDAPVAGLRSSPRPSPDTPPIPSPMPEPPSPKPPPVPLSSSSPPPIRLPPLVTVLMAISGNPEEAHSGVGFATVRATGPARPCHAVSCHGACLALPLGSHPYLLSPSLTLY
ncbi:hypothetical protein Vafri_17355 [Volvox africanus]|nr:hypothetical protein Vafri_17355 [Volvox africanus]